MKCPGQDKRYWGYDAIYEVRCPKCGERVELFKDEVRAKCKKCGHIFVNPRVKLGCAVYCRFASQCLGELSPDLVKKRREVLKDVVFHEVKRELKGDVKKLGRIAKAGEAAEKISLREEVDVPVVIISSFLAGLESMELSKRILDKVGADEELKRKVLEVLSKVYSGSLEGSVEARVVHDALLVAAGRSKVDDFLLESSRELFSSRS